MDADVAYVLEERRKAIAEAYARGRREALEEAARVVREHLGMSGDELAKQIMRLYDWRGAR